MNTQSKPSFTPANPEADRLLAGLANASISRREAVRRGLLGTAGLALAGGLGEQQVLAARPAKAKAVIQIWMWGGPPHLDTFDPKPEAGNDYCGPLKNPVATNVPGIRICEQLPLLAKQADKFSIIRSMTHGVNGHETASYEVQTGRKPGDGQVYPCAGAIVSLFKGYKAGYKGLIPPYVVLTRPQGRFSECGFLGGTYKPFATGGDPARTPFAVEGVVAEGITEKRQKSRRQLLQRLNSLDHAMKSDPQLLALGECEKEAYELILGKEGKVFDLSQERDEVRERYGRSTFGQSCLMARRLIEKGVPYVTINYEGWDLHKGIFGILNRKNPEMDKGMASLFQELKDRGLLDSTIVWWGGEFGRGPKIDWEAPWNGGRNHYGKVFSAVVGGGGFKGGHVVGASDDKGAEVKDRPVYPVDLIGSVYELLGIDTEAKLPHPEGLNVKVLAGAAEGVKTAGRLKEIM